MAEIENLEFLIEMTSDATRKRALTAELLLKAAQMEERDFRTHRTKWNFISTQAALVAGSRSVDKSTGLRMCLRCRSSVADHAYAPCGCLCLCGMCALVVTSDSRPVGGWRCDKCGLKPFRYRTNEPMILCIV